MRIRRPLNRHGPRPGHHSSLIEAEILGAIMKQFVAPGLGFQCQHKGAVGIDIDAGHWVHLNRDLPGHALSGADGLTAGVIGQPHVADDVLHTGNGPGVIGDPVQFRLVESDPHQVDRADDGIDRKIHIRDFPVGEHLES